MMTIEEIGGIIADFESETGYGLEIRDGRPYYGGVLARHA